MSLLQMNQLTRILCRTTISPVSRPSPSPLLRSVLTPSSSSSSSRPSTSSRTYATEAHLGNLSPTPGSTHRRKRIGRGIGSGRGGTSGRGHKGQGARSGNGKPKLHFAGGQTPITRAFPKRGFTNPSREEMTPLNLDRLQHWIDKGLLDPTMPITMKELVDSGCVHGTKHGVKLLGDGAEHFRTTNVHITVSRASSSAIAAIESLSGSIVARYENRLTLRALLNPEAFIVKGKNIPNKADPVTRRDILYYSNPEKRGYLALKAQEQKELSKVEAALEKSEAVLEA